MQRRDFFKNSSLAFLGSTLIHPGFGQSHTSQSKWSGRTAKNIIFMVSDGMSLGTLQLADSLLYRKEGRHSHWVQAMQEPGARRALMDTASASSLVTDSAAASSSWGGGKRVPNGSLNVNADGSYNKPVLQKFKAKGKAVGCVTSVPITHATPAGFCVNSSKRSAMEDIALDYHKLRFDVMMGGGVDIFSAEKRKDKKDLYTLFRNSGFKVVRNRNEMLGINSSDTKPILGVFHADSLPYEIDRRNDPALISATPTLAEMAKVAIDRLSKNKNGFVLQIEGGKVDWAAHANDAAALIYDQVAFDDAVKVALDFAKKDKDTLLIITTDHGNANPGLFYGDKANANFDRLQHVKHSSEWILMGIKNDFSPARVIERVEAAHGITITADEAKEILSHYKLKDGEGIYNAYKLPFREMAMIEQKYFSIGFGAMDHSADYVELTMFGPGSENLKPFVMNYELHNFMLQAANVAV